MGVYIQGGKLGTGYMNLNSRQCVFFSPLLSILLTLTPWLNGAKTGPRFIFLFFSRFIFFLFLSPIFSPSSISSIPILSSRC